MDGVLVDAQTNTMHEACPPPFNLMQRTDSLQSTEFQHAVPRTVTAARDREPGGIVD